jgi:putative DNA primase/helicase
MAQIFIDAEVAYSQNAIKSAVDTMKLGLPVMGNTARNLIGFSNGVFDTRLGQFRPHDKGLAYRCERIAIQRTSRR